jgi:ABC-2 type transport system ATP-binding protein
VLTTQILTEAEALCDDILIINHGREVARGDVDTIKSLASHPNASLEDVFVELMKPQADA